MNKHEMTLRKRVRSLAMAECCNYHKGECLETECICHLINDRYETVNDGMIDCDWFWTAVLPLQPELQCELLRELYGMHGTSIKPCTHCGKPFTPASNRQRYCNRCKQIGARLNGKERTQRWRGRKTDSACDGLGV